MLDTLTIKEITPEEKEYLENFKNVKVFSFNLTKLKCFYSTYYAQEST